MKRYQIIINGDYNMQLTIETNAESFAEATSTSKNDLQKLKSQLTKLVSEWQNIAYNVDKSTACEAQLEQRDTLNYCANKVLNAIS